MIRDLRIWLGGLYKQPDREFLPFGCRNHDPALAKDQAEAYRSGASAAVAMAQKILTQMEITDTGAGPPQPAATASNGKSPGSVQPAPRAVATAGEVRDAS